MCTVFCGVFCLVTFKYFFDRSWNEKFILFFSIELLRLNENIFILFIHWKLEIVRLSWIFLELNLMNKWKISNASTY